MKFDYQNELRNSKIKTNLLVNDFIIKLRIAIINKTFRSINYVDN